MVQNQQQKLKLNIPVTIVLVAFPLLLVLLSILFGLHYGLTLTDFLIAATVYYGSNIAVGIGLHRLWSHNSYKANKWVETALMVLSSGCLQGPVLAWVSDHKFHHAYADGELDPHSPLRYKSKLKGFLWAHIGWMIFGEPTTKHLDKATIQTLGRNRILTWQLRNYWSIATFMNIIPPILLGMLFYWEISLHAALAGLILGGLGRALQQQMTFCVNSLCHFYGSKKYVNDSSVDIWWLALFLLGENWHNFHHAFGRDYRNGHKWYHFDVHKWIIWSMSKIGLANNLVLTSEERINAKMEEMRSINKSNQSSTLELVAKASQYISDVTAQKLAELEAKAISAISMVENGRKDLGARFSDKISSGINSIKNSDIVRKSAVSLCETELKLQGTLLQLNSAAIELKEKASEAVSKFERCSDSVSDRLVTTITKTLKQLQKKASGLGIDHVQ